jgi:uncharacterized membrane protein HdeD (DUF308 family)
METVYNTAVGYERIKMYTAMGACIILGIILIICAIMSIVNPSSPPTNTTTNTTTNTSTNTPAETTPTTTSSVGWPWLILCGLVCFILAYGAYYMATNKSMENVLAAQGAIDAASSVSSLFDKHGGLFDIGD